MTLDQYLAQPGINASKLADASGLTPGTISRLLYGDIQPTTDTIRAIVLASGGAITADDLVFGSPRPRKVSAA